MAKADAHDYYNLSQLKELGWNDNLINDLLGEPDILKKNPRYASASPSKLFEKKRADEKMKSHIFSWHRHTSEKTAEASEKRRVARQKTNEEFYEKGKNLLKNAPAGVLTLDQKNLINRACDSYNNLQESRENYDFQYATAGSDKSFLERISMNYLYHTCSLYKDDQFPFGVDECFQSSKRFRDEFNTLICNAILKEIGEKYPHLQTACQKKRARDKEHRDYAECYFSGRETLSKKRGNLSTLDSDEITLEQFEETLNACKKKINWTDKKWPNLFIHFSTMTKEQLETIAHFAWKMDNARWVDVVSAHTPKKSTKLPPDQAATIDRFLNKSLEDENFERADFLLMISKRYADTKKRLETATARKTIPEKFFKKWIKSIEMNDDNVSSLLTFCQETGRGDLLSLIHVESVPFVRKELIRGWAETGEKRQVFWNWALLHCHTEIVDNFNIFLGMTYDKPTQRSFGFGVIDFLVDCINGRLDDNIIKDAFFVHAGRELPNWAASNIHLKAAHEKFALLQAVGECGHETRKQRQI